MERYQHVLGLRKAGVGLRAIARQLRMGRNTVRKFVRASQFPERADYGGKNAAAAVRQVAWLLVKKPEDRSAEEQAYPRALPEQNSALQRICALAERFAQMVRLRQAEALDEWLAEAKQASVEEELRGFAQGLESDRSAVQAALSLQWNNGQSEGQVNRLKWIKRSMYGRGSLELLRRRVLWRG